jgi:hypothetical protein
MQLIWKEIIMINKKILTAPTKLNKQVKNKTMEHTIKNHEFIKFNKGLNEQPTSETPMIVREMMIYNRQLIEENIMLRTEIKRLQANNSILNVQLTAEANCQNTSEESSESTQEESQPEALVLKKVRIQKKGTQIYIDPAIATMFSRQLKDSGYKLSEVCRAMMAICLERPRYRNMIFDRVKTSERISNTEREVTSFAFTYPMHLGENFTALLRSHKIKQYEFFEQMFKEFVQSYSFRKLLPAYIHQINQKKDYYNETYGGGEQ